MGRLKISDAHVSCRIDKDTKCLLAKYMEKEDKNKTEALRVLIKSGLEAARFIKVVEMMGGLEALEKDLAIEN